MPLNLKEIRKDFPILDRETRPGVRVTYLDSTATSQKPVQVINAMNDYYRHSNANIHRGGPCLLKKPLPCMKVRVRRLRNLLRIFCA